ncbi:MAG TPA: hypothetical protein VMW66_04580 [Elusimicrobiales bacterium]|nr:hypothetical protein [Elusimicrobiales bacterium]
MTAPHKIYLLLLKKYGHQGWWPVTPKKGIKPIYHARKYKPKTPREKLEICLGAILTQNTSWSNVEKVLINLNKEKLLSLEKLSKINIKKLQHLIKSSGYFVQKSKKIKLFCKFIKSQFEGDISRLFKEKTENLRGHLLSIWGIGPETADSILLYACNRPVFVIDAYTMRISKRMGWFGNLCYDGAQKFFKLNLPKSIKTYNEFHAMLVLLGKNFCKPKPLCKECPINKHCRKNV